MRAWAAALILALPLAGCLSGTDTTDGDPLAGPSHETPVSTDYPFLCDGAEQDVAGVDGVCAIILGEATGQLSEPALAAHPTDPDVMAVGAHFIGATAGTPRLVMAHLYVTMDGGVTWTRSIVPLPSADRYFSDPTLVILEDGTIVYAGIAVEYTTSIGGGTEIFTVRTHDGGATFEDPVIVSTPGAFSDREWLVDLDGRLYLSWTVIGDRSQVAFSDDGASWTGVADGIPGCVNAGPVAFLDGDPHVGCRDLDAEAVGLYRIHDDRFERVDTVPLDEITPNLFDLGDCWAVGTYWGGVAVGTPGGDWTTVRLAEVMGLDDGRREPYEYAALSDTDGHLHVLASPFHRYPQQGVEAAHDIYLVTLDKSLDRVQERRLSPTAPERFSGSISAVPPSVGDDWWTLTRDADGDLRMVWMYGGQVYIGRVDLDPWTGPDPARDKPTPRPQSL